MSYYHLARPGADLPLQLPEGAVITKARDTVASFGYSDLGSRTDVASSTPLDVEDITAMAGLAAARDAIREGTPLRTGARASRTPESHGGIRSRRPEIFASVSIRGSARRLCHRLCAPMRHRARRSRKATAIGLDAIKKSYGIDASGYELEVVERSFPAGKTELTWRSPAPKYGHVEQIHVNLQGERIMIVSARSSCRAATRRRHDRRPRMQAGRPRRSSAACS